MARPNLSYLKNLLLALVGVPCGVLTGLTGMTNSFVVAPLLNWLDGISGARLIGSTLAVTSFSALTGILAYAQLGSIRGPLTLAVAFGFLAGAAYAQRAGSDRPNVSEMGRSVGAAIASALALLMMADAHGIIHCHVLAAKPFNASWWFVPALILGAITGIAGRVLDLAGFLIVPGLYYVAGVPMIAAQGSALAILLVSSFPACFAYARQGMTEPRTAVWVSFGALFGALGGSRVTALHYDSRDMLMVYAIVMLVMVLVRLFSTPSNDAPAHTEGAP